MTSVAPGVIRNPGSVFLRATFMAQHGCLASLIHISFEDFWKSHRTGSQSTLAEMWPINWAHCHPK